MTENFGKQQIVIKGGKPWGFSLHNHSGNRSAIAVQQIEPGGKADMHGGLKVGDLVIKINDVFCLSLMDALQLIESAFRTLTILVWRPNYCISNSENMICNNVSIAPENSSNSSYSSYENQANLLNSKFHNEKCHVPLPNINENFLSNFIKSNNLSNSLQFPFANTSKSLTLQKKPSLCSIDSTCEINCCTLDFNVKNGSPIQLTQSQENANLQYISEQFPLSELFLNNETNLKLESLASHTKRLLKTSHQKEDIKSLRNEWVLKDAPSGLNEMISCTCSKSNCCEYPRCHNAYKSCKMHSPPEREMTTGTQVADYLCSQSAVNCASENEERNHLDSSRLFGKKASETYLMSCKNGLKIKEDGFRNSDLKVFKSHLTSINSKFLSQFWFDHQRQSEIHSDEQTSHFKEKCCEKNTALNYSMNQKKEKKYPNKLNHVSSIQKYHNKEIPLEHSFIGNSSKENKFILPNMKKETAFQPPHHYMNSYKCSYIEKQHSMDEEQCFTDENTQNNNCCTNSSCTRSSISPDHPLISPPANIDTDVDPPKISLPTSVSFSPVKDVVYENIDFIGKPEEAIYANLEMLKIKCSVIDSATQTSTLIPKSSRISGLETNQVIKTFSFVGTGIIATDAIGNKDDNMKNLLQSELPGELSIPKENLQESEKYLYQRYAINLPLTSTYFTTSEPKAKLLTRYINNHHDKDIIGGELNNKKEELMGSINKKLSVLRLEQVALKEEVKQNDELGSYLAKKLEKLAQPHETEKYRLHVEELEKITNLMLSLSGRLARAENALLILPSDASSEEKRTLEIKYSKLNQQYEEAKHLKKNIDRRNCQVSVFLRKYFTREEFVDYDHFIKMKTKLLLDCRELDEKIKLGEEQLAALKSSNNFKFHELQYFQ